MAAEERADSFETASLLSAGSQLLQEPGDSLETSALLSAGSQSLLDSSLPRLAVQTPVHTPRAAEARAALLPPARKHRLTSSLDTEVLLRKPSEPLLSRGLTPFLDELRVQVIVGSDQPGASV